ncbi:MAG: hypothetical protein KatS3mg108_1399 [Isosphaeraceae bacterium]|nr:MAG: hypothetical protein KatS3mg108_1399 [Isosphaeraceae bacterium]
MVENARVTVIHDGATVNENAEVDPKTGVVSMGPGQDRPLWSQDHGNKVEFRNL